MDARSPLFQNIACLLMGVMFLNPIVSVAADLAVDAAAGGKSQLTQAANGVPIVNIASANGNGLSHNKFTDYNVGAQGLILNNATGQTQSTQLGGIILGNSNLQGRAANLILNEVTGANTSQLKGYTEVAGQGAHVVVANPHGITCDGCGFINTPHATLTTGKPIVSSGQLQAYDVDGGAISVEGAGLNAANVSQFDLITRSAQINSDLYAQRLNIIAGRNQVNANSLNTTAKADDGSTQPQLAIDSSALGGMYAGAIRLVGTEAGVGVNLAGDMAASAGDIQIDANGYLSMARSLATADIQLNARSVALSGDSYAGGKAQLNATADIYVAEGQRLAAVGDVQITATQVVNRGQLESGRDEGGGLNPGSTLRIDAEELLNHGQITAHGALAVAAQTLDNQAGILVGSQAVDLHVTELDNRNGQVIGQKALSLTGSNLDNRNGTLASNQALTLNLNGNLDNSATGLLFSKTGGLSLTADQLNNAGGNLQTDQGELHLSASSLNNQSGSIQTTAGAMQLTVAEIYNRQGMLLARGGALTSNGSQLNNQQGWLQGDSLSITASDELNNNAGHLLATQGDAQFNSAQAVNVAGQMLAQGNLLLSGTNLNNQDGTLGAQLIDLSFTEALSNSNGLIEASDRLLLQADWLDNENGQLRALGESGESRIQLSSHFANSRGLVEIGNARFNLSSASLSNHDGSLLHLGSEGFTLNVADLNYAGGSLISNSDLNLSTTSWANSSRVQARNLTVSVAQFRQESAGQLIGTHGFSGSGTDWYSDGLLASDGDFSLNLSGDYSGYGNITSLGDMQLSAGSMRIGEGVTISSGDSVELDISDQLNNQGGQLTAVDSLLIHAAALENLAGTIGSGDRVRINTLSLYNQGLLFSGADMFLYSDSLTNRYGDIYSLGSLHIAKNAEGEQSSLVENRSGSIESSGDMSLSAAVLSNRKERFALGREQVSGSISMLCMDCSGDHFNVDFVATEVFDLMASEDSAAARIHSGGDLTIHGGSVSNQYSSLSAIGALSISSNTLSNLGAEAGVIEHKLRVNTGRTNDGDVVRLLQNYVNPYNAAALPKTIPDGISRLPEVSDIETFTANGLLAPALIQSGGAVTIQADQGLSNGSLSAFNVPVAGVVQQLDTRVGGNQQTLQVRLNPQLPPDLSQQAVNPLKLPGFSLPSGHGLFQLSQNPNPPYLIETNPAFASLKNFLNSDYLLSRLGYNSDAVQRRLGDGLYEQRLIQQAITARTGQRFIAGLDSDEAVFRYLMDNAIASKEELQLSVGVALSAEQVAALTHDIVWMESQEVSGQQVLVPVLYLAQANNRLAPSGALIQGQDLALISGGALNNSGTLLASRNLSASANSISNSGLIQANERLALLANDSIHNTQGGVINGQNVSAIALTGDISNERSISQQKRSGTGYSQLTSVLDNAARIEAGNDLSLSASGDIRNIGGVIRADGNAELSAEGDVIIASAAEQQAMLRQDKRHYWEQSSTTQHASEVQLGNDLSINAGGTLSLIASTLKASGDINLAADGNVILASAANDSSSEYRYKGNGKKINVEKSTIRQQASVIEAGGDVGVLAGNDLILSSSQIDAGSEAFLYAGNQLALLSAQSSDYYLYDYSKKGSWGSKKTQKDEITTVTNVGSQITSGGNLILASEGDQTYQRARLDSGNDLILDSGGVISFEAVKDLKQESHEKSKSDLSWNSSKGKGTTDETLRQSILLAQGKLAIKAADGLNIDIKQINQQSITQTIDAMVKAEPQLAWLKQAEARGDVDWQRVKEVHDSFKYSNSGLGAGAAIALAIAIAAITAGAASAAVGSIAGATAGSGSVMAAASATTMAGIGNVAATAALTSMAATAGISAINNRGDLSAVAADTFSSNSLQNYATAAVIAGFTAYTSDWGRVPAQEGNYRTVSIPERLQAYSANTALKGLLSGEDDSQSWLAIAGTGAAMELYQYWAGREPNIRPGVERPDKPEFVPLDEGLVPRVEENGQWREGINIGHNTGGCTFYEICHGTPISHGLNTVPGFNAFATLHDTFMDKMEIAAGVEPSLFQNIGTMPPALLINYGALYDKYRVIGEQAKFNTERR